MDVCLQQKDMPFKMNLILVGIYEPIENIIFNITFPFYDLSIDIRDISNVKYSSNDDLNKYHGN